MSGFRERRVTPPHSEEDSELRGKLVADEERRFREETHDRGIVFPGQLSPSDGRATPGAVAGRQVTVTFAQSEQDVPLHHGLKRKCTRFLVLDINASAVPYRVKDPSADTLWLRCTVPGVTAKILCIPDTDGRVRRHG